MQSSSSVCLKDLCSLKNDEEMLCQEILNTLNSHDDNEKKEMLKEMATYPFGLLYAFSKKSPEINFLLENDDYLNQCFASRLQSGYVFHRIKSFMGILKYQYFAVKGAVLLNALTNLTLIYLIPTFGKLKQYWSYRHLFSD